MKFPAYCMLVQQVQAARWHENKKNAEQNGTAGTASHNIQL